MKLDVRNLSVRYGNHVAVHDISLTARRGEIVALLGPSGCGKSTLLRSIAGLVKPYRGEIWIGDRNITSTPIHERRLGLVFQNYALFSHLNVQNNILFGLRMRGIPSAEWNARIDNILAALRLEPFRLKNVTELSGGQQQRVALARTLVTNPEILLLDEPLSALDRQLREQARIEIRRLVKTIGTTTLIVTHDQEEAMGLADHIVVMRDGRVEQRGTGLDLYTKPANVFVAGFLGKANVIPARINRTSSGFALRIGSAGDTIAVPEAIVRRAFSIRSQRPAQSLFGRRRCTAHWLNGSMGVITGSGVASRIALSSDRLGKSSSTYRVCRYR